MRYLLQKYSDETYGYKGFDDIKTSDFLFKDHGKVILEQQEYEDREEFIRKNNIEFKNNEYGSNEKLDIQILNLDRSSAEEFLKYNLPYGIEKLYKLTCFDVESYILNECGPNIDKIQHNPYHKLNKDFKTLLNFIVDNKINIFKYDIRDEDFLAGISFDLEQLCEDYNYEFSFDLMNDEEEVITFIEKLCEKLNLTYCISYGYEAPFSNAGGGDYLYPYPFKGSDGKTEKLLEINEEDIDKNQYKLVYIRDMGDCYIPIDEDPDRLDSDDFNPYLSKIKRFYKSSYDEKIYIDYTKYPDIYDYDIWVLKYFSTT